MSDPDFSFDNTHASERNGDLWLRQLSDVQRFELNLSAVSIDLSDIDAVQWSRWTTATGTATMFPDLFRRASTARHWRSPLEQILYGCCCVNELHSAAVPTYAFLVRFLAVDHPDRQAVLLDELATWIWCANWSDLCLDGQSTEFLIRRSIAGHRDIYNLMHASGDPAIQVRAERVLQIIDEPLVACPVCGQKLRSLRAQQCFHCGEVWR